MFKKLAYNLSALILLISSSTQASISIILDKKNYRSDELIQVIRNKTVQNVNVFELNDYKSAYKESMSADVYVSIGKNSADYLKKIDVEFISLYAGPTQNNKQFNIEHNIDASQIFELASDLMPKRNIGIIYHQEDKHTEQTVKKLQKTNKTLFLHSVEKPNKIVKEVRNFVNRNRLDALLILPERSLEFKLFNSTTLSSCLFYLYEKRVAAFGYSKDLLKAGLLASIEVTQDQLIDSLFEAIENKNNSGIFSITKKTGDITYNHRLARYLRITLPRGDKQ